MAVWRRYPLIVGLIASRLLSMTIDITSSLRRCLLQFNYPDHYTYRFHIFIKLTHRNITETGQVHLAHECESELTHSFFQFKLFDVSCRTICTILL